MAAICGPTVNERVDMAAICGPRYMKIYHHNY